MTTHAQTRIQRAIRANEEARILSASRGDLAEEKRRGNAVIELGRKVRSQEKSADGFIRLVASMERDGGRVSRVDWLAKIAANPKNGLGPSHLRTAMILRDHIQAAASGPAEVQERVDGGRIHNGQMETLIDRRRPIRYALNAAIEAVTDRSLLPGVLHVIVWGGSLQQACAMCGKRPGKAYARMLAGIVEALDAAAAHIGVSG